MKNEVSDQEKLKGKVVTGGVILVVKRILVQFILTISNIFLARLLFPADFGVFAIVIFVTTFFSVFVDIGFGLSLIQKKGRLQDADIKTAFSVQIVLSLLIILLIWLLAPKVSNFYNLGKMGIDLLRLYALTFLFLPLKVTTGAILERDLHYLRLVAIELVQTLATSLLTVALAFGKLGVFSFVYGAVAGGAFGNLLYLLLAPWKLGFSIALKNFFVLTRFGAHVQASMVLGLFYGPLILLYLGKMVGLVNLGYFHFASSFAVFTMAASEIINRIIFPLGSRRQGDRLMIKKIVERAIMVVSLTTLPIVAVILSAAPAIIHYFYTDRWLAALPAIYIAGLQMAIIAYTGIFAQVLLALGKSPVIRNMGLVWATLTWILGPPLIGKFNFVGMSLTGLLVSASGIWLFFRLRREVDIAFWPNFWPYLACTMVAGFLVFLMVKFWVFGLASLILVLLLGGGIYLVLIWWLCRKFLMENLREVVATFRR